MPIYIKLYVPIIFIAGLLIYYFSGNPIYLLFRSLSYIFLFFWYWQNFKDKLRFSSLFVFIHLTIAIVVPIVLFISEKKSLSINAELIVSLIANLCLLIVFAENIFLRKYNLEKGILKKIFLPYIVLPIVFLCFAIFPKLSYLDIILISGFAVILITTGILSVYYSNKEAVKLYVSWGMFLLILAQGMSAINLFSYRYVAAYAIVFFLALISKVLIIYGLIKEHEQ